MLFPKSVDAVDTIYAAKRLQGAGLLAQEIVEAKERRGMDKLTKEPPANVIVPLIEAAILEDDDLLRKMWAKMFLNTMDMDNKAEVRRAYVSIRQDCKRLDVRVLAKLHDAERKRPDKAPLTTYLPDKVYYDPATTPIKEGRTAHSRRFLPQPEIRRSLWNLGRLGLIGPGALGEGDRAMARAMITALGIDLVEACTSPRAG